MATELTKVERTKMGATKPIYAKIKTRTEGGKITYDTVKAFSEFVSLTENLEYAESQFHSNNKKSESARQFRGCDLTFANKGLSQENVADVFGATLNENDDLVYGANDAAPRIGFAFFRELEDDGTRYYEGVFYPDCKAFLGNANDNTRGENITYNGDSTSLEAYAMDDTAGTWKVEHIFATAQEAETWCKEQFTGA